MNEILCFATFDIICTFSFDTKCIHRIMDFQILLSKKKITQIFIKEKKSLIQIIVLNVLKQTTLKYFTDMKNKIWVNAGCNIFFYLLG
jgi:hypothetical protein